MTAGKSWNKSELIINPFHSVCWATRVLKSWGNLRDLPKWFADFYSSVLAVEQESRPGSMALIWDCSSKLPLPLAKSDTLELSSVSYSCFHPLPSSPNFAIFTLEMWLPWAQRCEDRKLPCFPENHWTVWVGRDFKEHPVPNPSHGQGHLSWMVAPSPVQLAL